MLLLVLMEKVYDVVVVGSGISGLYAAHQLKKNGLNVLLVEAANYIGGRLKQVSSSLTN